MKIRKNLNSRKIRALATALIALFVIRYAAMQLASTPGFCGNCHQIYPAYESWRRSIHLGVTCTGCHAQPGIIEATGRVFLQLFVFNNPKNQPKVYVKERKLVNRACWQCHSPNRTMAFSGGLNVPHKKHLKKGFMCTICHLKLVHGEGNEKTRKPEMETCMKCHDGKTAPEGCGVCHITLPELIDDY